jgi:hypothetical protein
MAQVQAFMQSALTFPKAGFFTQYAAPAATAFTVTLISGSLDIHLILTPTGPFAGGTIVLPPSVSCVDGQRVLINTTQAITTLTINGNGATSIVGAPIGMEANSAFSLAFDAPTSNWYMLSNSAQSPVTLNGTQTLTNKIISGGTISSAALLSVTIGGTSTGDLTGFTGLPFRTGIAGVVMPQSADFLQTPNSANLAALMTDETGTGRLVFATSPALITPNVGAATADSLSRGSPVTKTTSFTLAATENWVICNGGATITATLPSPTAAVGREVMMKNIASFTVVSAASNIVPLAGGAASTAIMPATPGARVTLVSDGTNWIIMGQ